MSELRVAEIHNPNDQTGGITIDNDDNVSINGSPIGNQGALGNRNLIINGAMQVAQRGDEETGVNLTGYRTCDRFRHVIGALGTWTIQQSTESPDGFSNSLRMLCTTANASPASDGSCSIQYKVEGFDCQRLIDTGTTTHPMRLSFWVKAIAAAETFPKTASIELAQPDNLSRQFTTSYTIQASDTWEHKVIEIPADTAAVFNNDNGESLIVQWWLNGGSDFTSGSHSAGWVAADNTARNATNLGVGGTVNDEFCLTGVQLEVGTNATAFEWRSHAAELALCKRYFQSIGEESLTTQRITTGLGFTNTVLTTFLFPYEMRAQPQFSISDGAETEGLLEDGGLTFETADIVGNVMNRKGCTISFEGVAGEITVGDPYMVSLRGQNFLFFDAEL